MHIWLEACISRQTSFQWLCTLEREFPDVSEDEGSCGAVDTAARLCQCYERASISFKCFGNEVEKIFRKLGESLHDGTGELF
jgi:hypothetical protein